MTIQAQDEWDIPTGSTIDRPALHKQYGGRIHARISPSRRSNNVFLFLTPSPFDGSVGSTGLVQFSGEGGTNGADQTLTRGNKTLHQHRAEGRTLRLFTELPGQPTRYVGRAHLDESEPFTRADIPVDPVAPNGEHRRVLIFRLWLLDPAPHALPLAPPHTAQGATTECGPGQGHAQTAGQAALDLLRDYQMHLVGAAKGFRPAGCRIQPPGAVPALYADLYDATHRELIAVRQSASRQAVASGIGELAHLASLMDPRPAHSTLVLPGAPYPEQIDLLHRLGITPAWPDGSGAFTHLPAPNTD
ncbi:hypothetical protein [Streptomyces xiamenensis]|uniref:hypothetical protein n=1 Tax=Streptomyces xiamenensis TaxID=408015 RepID=UPI0035DB2577